MKLTVRFQAMQSTCPDDNVEANIVPVDSEFDLDPSETALVLVDVWGGHHIKSHYERTGVIMAETIRPCIEAARSCGVAVIYAPSPRIARTYPQSARYGVGSEIARPDGPEHDEWPPGDYRDAKGKYSSLARPYNEKIPGYDGDLPEWWHIRAIAEVIEPQADDFVVATGEQLHLLLRDRRIVNLVYAGFATNICVVYRDYGLQAMRARGYRPVLLRDCTSAIETRDTFDTLLITRTLILDLERWFPTSDSAAFIQACSREP